MLIQVPWEFTPWICEIYSEIPNLCAGSSSLPGGTIKRSKGFRARLADGYGGGLFLFFRNQARPDNLDRLAALSLAGKDCLRLSAGPLVTLALGIGQGATGQQPLAIAIMAGLAIQITKVLIVPPDLATLGRHIFP